MQFLLNSQTGGGECNPCTDVCSNYSSNADSQTSEFHINTDFIRIPSFSQKLSVNSTLTILTKLFVVKDCTLVHKRTISWIFPSLQVAPKPMNTTSQIVTTSQPQQRLIMPATPLPQIQPNLTNLPPGTVLAPAHGTGNVGYAFLPAQYVTQVWDDEKEFTKIMYSVYN